MVSLSVFLTPAEDVVRASQPAPQHWCPQCAIQRRVPPISDVLELLHLQSLQAETPQRGACLPLSPLFPPEPSPPAAPIQQSCFARTGMPPASGNLTPSLPAFGFPGVLRQSPGA